MYKEKLGPKASLDEAEKSLLVLEKEAAVLAVEAQREPSSLEVQFRGLLAEAEIDLAGLEARSKLLGSRRKEIEALRERNSVLDAEQREVQDKVGDLNDRIKDLQRLLNVGSVQAPDLKWYTDQKNRIEERKPMNK